MGRNAPQPSYEFEPCFVQTFDATPTGSITSISTGLIKSGFLSQIIEQGHDVVVSLPVGATGSGITGCTILGKGGFVTEGNSFYPNNGLVVINDESRAVINTSNFLNTSIRNDIYPNTNQLVNNGAAQISQNLYTSANQNQDNRSGVAPLALKVTGVSLLNPATGATSITGYACSFVDLHSGYGLLTSYSNNNNGAAGRTVRCSLINYLESGSIFISGINLTDTIDIASSGSLCVPSVAKDLSYTGGNISRVLIGYQSDTGVTSGQLCAQLLQISGTTLTTGDPVVIRSVAVGAGAKNYVNFIEITHHFKGSVNAFVISTAVKNGATNGTASGELIAANPASGVVLSGSFGSAVPIMNTSGSLSGCFQPICTALNTFTGSNAYGVVIALTGTSSTRAFATRQMYEVSGNTITTGVISTGLFPVVEPSGVQGGSSFQCLGVANTNFPVLATGFFVTPKATEISSKVTTSGLISHVSYANLTTGASITTTGDCFINFLHVPYSLTETGFSQYATVNTTFTVVNRIGLHVPTDIPFFTISGNPYNGAHGSYLEVVSVPTGNTAVGFRSTLYASGLGLVTLTTATGYFPYGAFASSTGFFAGVFFSGNYISGASNNTYGSTSGSICAHRIRSTYCFTSGTSFATPVLFNTSNQTWTTGTPVILQTFGTYPNITGLLIHFASPSLSNSYRNLSQISIPLPTGEQVYKRNLDLFKTPTVKSIRQFEILGAINVTGTTAFTQYTPECIGVAINAATGTSDGRFTLTSGINYLTTGQVIVKFAKTERAKRDLINSALGEYTITENKTIFQ